MPNCIFQTSPVDLRHIRMGVETGFELLSSWADEYYSLAKVYVLVSYEIVAAYRVMVGIDQLYIQYHNYSKSWCNVSHIE